MIDTSGNKVVEYEYNPWGELLSVTGSAASTLGQANPFRYRGYYYDTETGLYYVSSRYYDPEISRWINADGVIAGTSDSVQGYNQFAYCFNNPINMEDETGHWPTWSDVKKWAKKTIEKIGEALEESFVFEVGVGVGLETTDTKLKVGAYQDGYTFGYANGEDYTSVKTSVGAGAPMMGVVFDVNYEIEHRHETDGVWLRDGHDAFSSPFELAACKNITIETPMGFSINELAFSYSGEDIFIGLSNSKHFLVGGHYQIGFNVTKFIEVFADE